MLKLKAKQDKIGQYLISEYVFHPKSHKNWVVNLIGVMREEGTADVSSTRNVSSPFGSRLAFHHSDQPLADNLVFHPTSRRSPPSSLQGKLHTAQIEHWPECQFITQWMHAVRCLLQSAEETEASEM